MDHHSRLTESLLRIEMENFQVFFNKGERPVRKIQKWYTHKYETVISCTHVACTGEMCLLCYFNRLMPADHTLSRCVSE